MTAEQALIEENKKDPRVRYITQDEENNTYVWIDKPIHIISALNYWNGFYAKKIDFQVDFNTEKSEDCILCIDDIKEVPPIPEKLLKEEPEEKEESQKEEELSIPANKSINPLLFSGRYIKTGRIEVPNSFDGSFESQKKHTQPEVKTLYPRRMWIEDRINAINQSVKSYLDNDYCIPTDWIEERNELIETLNNL